MLRVKDSKVSNISFLFFWSLYYNGVYSLVDKLNQIRVGLRKVFGCNNMGVFQEEKIDWNQNFYILG